MLFGMPVESRLGLGITILRKCLGRYRDLRIKSRIVRMRCHDLRVWKGLTVLHNYSRAAMKPKDVGS